MMKIYSVRGSWLDRIHHGRVNHNLLSHIPGPPQARLVLQEVSVSEVALDTGNTGLDRDWDTEGRGTGPMVSVFSFKIFMIFLFL